MTPDYGDFVLIHNEYQTHIVGQWSLLPDSDDISVTINGHGYLVECNRDLPRGLPSSFHVGSRCIILSLANVFRFDERRRRPHNPLAAS